MEESRIPKSEKHVHAEAITQDSAYSFLLFQRNYPQGSPTKDQTLNGDYYLGVLIVYGPGMFEFDMNTGNKEHGLCCMTLYGIQKQDYMHFLSHKGIVVSSHIFVWYGSM